VPSPNSVVFRDGVANLGDDGTTAFTVEQLAISTPGDFGITQQVAAGIAAVADLVFQAGRPTEDESAAGRGTLTIAAATALTASDTLTLAAGGSGFGDLVFAGSGTSLAADEIELRASSIGQSRNGDSGDLSRIVGLQSQSVTLRDAAGAIFGDAGSSASAFRYRQAAGIDAAVDLPALAQFGLADVGPTAGFRAAGDVDYGVRSDQGQIDLDDGIAGTNEADRFRNASLSLVGLQSSNTPAIQVSADTAFVGRQVELGGVSGFTFTGALARVFNRSGTDAGESLTLRSGLGGIGNLEFSSDGGSPVVVKAPTVKLVAGDGVAGANGSTIDTRNASFDLAGPVGAARTFAYQIDGTFRIGDLPGVGQFVGGAAGLPSVLAIRNDAGEITIDDFDASELPLGLANGPARLVLEAEAINLSQKDGDDLELTTDPNLFLRLRTQALSLQAFVSDDADTESGRVRMGPRPADTQRLTGVDAEFDGESLLIEAFDGTNDLATTGNLSTVSEFPEDSGLYDLAAGRGPTSISIKQDGSVLAADLAHRNAFSGQLSRTIVDDADDDPIASIYAIESRLGTVTVTPENVNGSNLTLVGVGASPTDGAIDFAPGTGPAPGLFTLANLNAQTKQSIVVRAGTRLVASDGITLTAAAIDQPNKKALTGTQGSIRFEGDHADGQVTRLEANSITLAAGPPFSLSNPDSDNDGERDPIPAADLPRLHLEGLDQLVLAGDPETSGVHLRQNAAFDSTRGGQGDFLTALEAGVNPGGVKWNEIELLSVQGLLTVTELDLLAAESRSLFAITGIDGKVLVDVPDAAVTTSPFDDFEEDVEIRSNDITFSSDDVATAINLATDKLVLVAQSILTTSTRGTLGRVRRDIALDDDPQFRPIVRIHQAAPFTNTELPRPSQYAVLDTAGSTTLRRELSGLDIELVSTTNGTTLTLDDAIRARTTGSNLILRSAGDVAIALTDRTPGYQDLPAYAALQLASLDVEARAGDGAIRIEPFTIDGQPADLTIETAGDQRFGSVVELANTLITNGRDILFAGDVTQQGDPDAGLVVGTSGTVRFLGDIGTLADRLDRLWVLFDVSANADGSVSKTPTAEFGARVDLDGDGVPETPVDSDQSVHTTNDILFLASDLPVRTLVSRLETAIEDVEDLGDLDILLRSSDASLGRPTPANFATVGKALGDLVFDSLSGLFTSGAGEKVSVGGRLTIDTSSALAAFSDVSALELEVAANEIGLLRRDSGITADAKGQTHKDGGPAIVANTLDFGAVTPRVIGRGRNPRFGLPDPFRAQDQYPFLHDLAVFAIRPGDRPLTTRDFVFEAGGNLAERIPFVVPTGPSRSDLSGAYGPVRVPTPRTKLADPMRLADPGRLAALAVDVRPTPDDVVRARLTGVAVIDDRGLVAKDGGALVSEARLDARDAERAIALYDKLFGAQDERAPQVRGVLQKALDDYLESHRARRVVGFELRLFVKNRPSTLIEAYTTLEDLDALFRYHRRLGLSPGEFKRIQRDWLAKIKPDGIELDELAETVHPSRYVRGSDILDIFGQ